MDMAKVGVKVRVFFVCWRLLSVFFLVGYKAMVVVVIILIAEVTAVPVIMTQ